MDAARAQEFADICARLERDNGLVSGHLFVSQAAAYQALDDRETLVSIVQDLLGTSIHRPADACDACEGAGDIPVEACCGAVNNCDGCQRGLPVNEGGLHFVPSSDYLKGMTVMSCTASRYGFKPNQTGCCGNKVPSSKSCDICKGTGRKST